MRLLLEARGKGGRRHRSQRGCRPRPRTAEKAPVRGLAASAPQPPGFSAVSPGPDSGPAILPDAMRRRPSTPRPLGGGGEGSAALGTPGSSSSRHPAGAGKSEEGATRWAPADGTPDTEGTRPWAGMGGTVGRWLYPEA